MTTARLTKLMLSFLLVIAVIIAFQVIRPSANPAASMSAYTGRGDYQRFETMFFQPYTGRGDYQRYELQFFPHNAGSPESNRSAVGMGDLHRFEGLTPNQVAGTTANNNRYVGMGDLHRFEATQTIEYTAKIPLTP